MYHISVRWLRVASLTLTVIAVSALGIATISTGAADAGQVSVASTSNPVQVPLGPIGFGGIVIDSTLREIFVAGSSTNVVEVFSYAGGLVGTVNHVDDPTAMLLVGPTLYVTGDTNGVVTAIDTKTLTTKVVASGLNGPSSIAFTDKRLWVSLLTPRRKPAIASIAC